MKPLSETNAVFRDPEMRRRLLVRNALASSTFEGARGLKTPVPYKPAAPRSSASTKNAAKSSV